MENIDLFQQEPERTAEAQADSLKEYRKHNADPQRQKTLRTYCIIGYVLCGLNIVLGLLANWMVLLEMGVLLALLIGVHKNKSKACAIGVLVYSIVNCLLLLLTTGSVSGWVWLILGIGMVSTIGKIDKDYREEKMKNPAVSQDMFQSFEE